MVAELFLFGLYVGGFFLQDIQTDFPIIVTAVTVTAVTIIVF